MLSAIYLTLAGGFAIAYLLRLRAEPPNAARSMLGVLALGGLMAACAIEAVHVIILAQASAAAALLLGAGGRGASGWFVGATLFVGLLAYGSAFLLAGGGIGLSAAAITWQAVAVAMGAGLAMRLLPRAGPLAAPYAVYAAIATGTAALAFGAGEPLRLAGFGMLALLFSDATLASLALEPLNGGAFRRARRRGQWALAFAGHALIAAAFLAPPS